MTKQSLQAVRQIFTVKQPKMLADNGRALLIKTAREGIARIKSEQAARAGIAPDVVVRVNGATGKPVESVGIPGPIEAIFDYRREIVEVGLVALMQASPRQSGAYANSHTVLLNGRSVPELPANLSKGDVYALTNPIVYARRVEIGKTKAGRKFVLQVPDRIYERVAKNILMPRYSGVAQIEFKYIPLEGAYITKGKLASHITTHHRSTKGGNIVDTVRRRRRNQKAGTAVMAPAIVIRARTR